MAAADDTDVNTDEAKLARKWIAALDECDKWQRSYLERCKRIVRRYRNELAQANAQDMSNGENRRFAILWSNMETLKPAVYAHSPNPVVTRRYKDADPVGRVASEVIERSLSYSMDQYEFDDHIKLARDDYLLLARGNVWVRYVPHQTVIPDAEITSPQQELQEDGPSITQDTEASDIPYAEVVCDHVAFDDWGMQPCRSWDETGYIWRRAFMDREALVARFGKVGRKVPLDWAPEDDTTTDNDRRETKKRAAVYEIWSKEERKVYWISRSYPAGPLDVKDDWLKLKGFYPCPRPLMGTLAPDSYLPIPDFVYYQDQAEELDELTSRIGILIEALKLIGVYAGEEDIHLQNLFQNRSGTLVPIANMAMWQDKGGFKGVIEWVPIEQVAATLRECFEARTKILNDIYQITGMADIIRGMSDPRETATAQEMKGQWGSLRIRDKQKELARFARDVLRLQAEIISTLFTPQTLKLMTDVKLFDTQAQKQQIAAVIQRNQAPPPAPMPGAPPMPAPQPIPIPPEMQEMASRPTWEEVIGLMKNSALRSFRVDVETDSTIEPDEQQEKQARVEFLTTIGTMIAQSLPLLQAAPQAAPLIRESILFAARGFRVGREMEDVIEQTFDALMKNPPKELGQKGAQADPAAGQVAAMELQQEQVKGQNALQLQAMKMQEAQAQLPIKQAELQLQQQDQNIRVLALQRDPNPQAVSNG